MTELIGGHFPLVELSDVLKRKKRSASPRWPSVFTFWRWSRGSKACCVVAWSNVSHRLPL